MYHAIEATVPGGSKSSLMGVSVLSSQERSIQWALMTVEGFVLFSGRYSDNRLTIDRAVGPFDHPGFAQGLMDDLMLIFFKPLSPLSQTGWSEQGEPVCRYASADQTTDIIARGANAWSIRRFNSKKSLDRTLECRGRVHNGTSLFARHMVLKKRGLMGYELELKLVEAVPID